MNCLFYMYNDVSVEARSTIHKFCWLNVRKLGTNRSCASETRLSADFCWEAAIHPWGCLETVKTTTHTPNNLNSLTGEIVRRLCFSLKSREANCRETIINWDSNWFWGKIKLLLGFMIGRTKTRVRRTEIMVQNTHGHRKYRDGAWTRLMGAGGSHCGEVAEVKCACF